MKRAHALGVVARAYCTDEEPPAELGRVERVHYAFAQNRGGRACAHCGLQSYPWDFCPVGLRYGEFLDFCTVLCARVADERVMIMQLLDERPLVVAMDEILAKVNAANSDE